MGIEGPDKFEKVPLSLVLEEDLVAEVHSHRDRLKNGEEKIEEALEALPLIREGIAQLECYPIYREYVNGNVPTLDTFRNGTRLASETIASDLAQEKGLSSEDLSEELHVQKLLEGRAGSIEHAIDAYVRSVIKFHNLKRISRGGVRDMTKQFEQSDHERRRAHNHLLDTLQSTTQAVRDAVELKLIPLEKVLEWNPGVESIPQENAIVVFSPKILEDRNYIRDWAIAADFDERLRELDTYTQKSEEPRQ